MDEGAAVVAAARGWIGTPWRHGASLRGAGADCLGLIRGVWRDLLGPEPETVAPYGPDHGDATGEEALWAAGRRLLRERDPVSAQAGDVLLLRMRREGPAKHLGVLAAGADGAPTLIHAYSRLGVVESPLGESWRRRVAAAFAFPVGDVRWRP
jgi:NlpC/P60 family putative phage cell wall peptidase